MSDMQLHIRFDDQSHSYVHGFEAGMIYQRIKDGECLIEEQVHSANIKTLDEMATAEGFSIEWQGVPDYPTYSVVKMQKEVLA